MDTAMPPAENTTRRHHAITRWIVLAGLMFCAATVGAQEKIEYGYPEQSIFAASINAQGQPDSPMNWLAEALMERAGIPLRAVPYPANRLFKNLQDGTTNFSILVKASALEDCCLFSRQPVYSTELNVYFIGDKPPVNSTEDLVGKSIITIRGYSYAGLLKYISEPANKVTNTAAGTHRAAFEMLRAERADYLIDYASAANDILADHPIAQLRTHTIDKLDIHLVLSKTYPEAENLMARLEAIVKTLNINEIVRGIKPRK